MDTILTIQCIFAVASVFVIDGIHADPGAATGTFTTTKIGPKPIWNSTTTDRLRHDLLLNYDKFARPTQHNNVTTVSFGMTIRHMEVNEHKSTVTLHTYVQLIWNDDKLKWNSSEYDGMVSVSLGEHEIWQPDIFLYNSATAASVNQYGNMLCISYPDGKILWVPPAQFSAICSLDLKYWPFDTHVCEFIFGSWTYHGEQIDLQMINAKTGIDLELLATNSEWKIIKTETERFVKTYSCCKEGYPEIHLNLTIQRISPMYKAFVITPAVSIIMLTLLSFWLPPQAGEKIILNGCLAMITVLYLLYFAQKLPALASGAPLIVFFFSSSLYATCFTTLNSVLVIWLSRTCHTKTLPWIIKQPLTGFLGKWLGLGHYVTEPDINFHRATAEEMRDHQVTDFDEHISSDDHQIIDTINKVPLQQDWILLAAAIDRLAFVFYSLLFAILAISYSV